MEVTAVVARMSPEEARACVDQIKSNLEDVRAQLFELHERDGWEALGYPTWQACIQAEFHLSKQRAHQLLNAHLVDRILAAPYQESTNVDPHMPVARIEESHARELAPLIAEPEALREVYAEVQERTNGQPTAADVHDGVDQYFGRSSAPAPTRRVPNSDFTDDYVEDVNQDFEDEAKTCAESAHVSKPARGLTVGMPDEEREEYERRQRATVSFARSTSSLHALLQPAPQRIAQDWLPAENGLARIAGCEQLWTGPGLRELAGWLAQAADAWEAARA